MMPRNQTQFMFKHCKKKIRLVLRARRNAPVIGSYNAPTVTRSDYANRQACSRHLAETLFLKLLFFRKQAQHVVLEMLANRYFVLSHL